MQRGRSDTSLGGGPSRREGWRRRPGHRALAGSHIKLSAEGLWMPYPEHCGRFGGCDKCEEDDCTWDGSNRESKSRE